MKRYRYFMVMLTMSVMVLPSYASEAVQMAAKTAFENLTGKNIAKLYKTRIEVEDPDQCEVIMQACIAGLYAIGDAKNARQINQGRNRDGFIDSLMKECDLCHGEGHSQEGCYKCKGSGACQNRKCNNGIVTTAGFDGRSNARKCFNCEGSGKCTNCKGTGKVARTCSRCNGSKMAIDKAIALASCKDKLNALIAGDSENREQVRTEETARLAKAKAEEAAEKGIREDGNTVQAKGDNRKSGVGMVQQGLCANESGTDARFLKYKFDFEKYHRWKDDETTSIQKDKIFKEFVVMGFWSGLYKDYVRVWFALVPDGLSFVVTDVQEEIFDFKRVSFDVHQCSTYSVKAYSVELKLPSYDSTENKGVASWQNDELLRGRDKQWLLNGYSRYHLLIPARAENVSDWKKGKIIVSKGWIYDVTVIDAVVTYNNGSTGVDQRIGFGGYGFCDYMFRSMAERAMFD